MAYWLCITNEENWKVIKAKNVWGVPERHERTIAKVKPGDKLLIYLKQDKPLIPKLKFITNKKKWSGDLMGKDMEEIPEEDFRLILGSE